MVRTKLVPKRVRIKPWPSREPYTKFKIKTLLPEQKVVQIKKDGQVIRTVTVRRKQKNLQINELKTSKKCLLQVGVKNSPEMPKNLRLQEQVKKKGFILLEYLRRYRM